MMTEEPPKKLNGFAAMDPERRREIASKGGKSVHPGKRASFAALDPERRREISAMGGKAIPAEKRSFSTNPELAKRAGAKGGHARRNSGKET
jgi:uncharacterized protein